MNSTTDPETEALEALTPLQRKHRERVLALSLGVTLAIVCVFPLAFLADSLGLWGEAPAAFDLQFTDPRDPRVVERERLVLEELQWGRDLPSWAGTYTAGDGLRSNSILQLAPDHGFAFSCSGCQGLNDQDVGQVHVEGHRVRLSSELTEGEGEPSGLPGELVFVPWGTRKYMIAPDQMIAFTQDVRSGHEPRDSEFGHYLADLGGDPTPPAGLPQIPAEFADAADAPPIRARIVEILTPPADVPEDGEVQVRLDLGRKTGAYRGLRLSLEDPGEGFAWARIDEVQDEGCIARVRPSREELVPELGWTFLLQRED